MRSSPAHHYELGIHKHHLTKRPETLITTSLLVCALLCVCVCVTARPGSVESAVTAAVGPVSMAGYIVACEHGRVRDVTNRYFSNALSLKKLRDEAWWEQTARALHSLPPVGAHNAQASQVIRTDVGTQPQQRAAAGAAGWTEGGAEGQGGCGGGVLQTSQAPDSAHSHSLSLPDALKTGVTPDDDAGAAERAEEAAAAAAASMRAKREAAELEHKQKTGLSGLPTSIEGFKVHPLYVLKRHITKYEVGMCVSIRPLSHKHTLLMLAWANTGTAPCSLDHPDSHSGQPLFPCCSKQRHQLRQHHDLAPGVPPTQSNHRL